MFDYAAPTTISQALELLATPDADVRLLAGGQSLLILLRQRLVSPDLLVSLTRVEGLDTIDLGDDRLRIGATATYRRVAAPAGVAGWVPVLARAAGSVGSLHIRNRGTVGGAVCHADPAGDVPTALLVTDAVLRTARPGSTGTYPVAEFFTGLFETRLADDELLHAIDVPRQPDGATFGYRRFCYREGEYPMAIGAVRLEWEGAVCRSARIAVGGGHLHPLRLPAIEAQLVGTPVDHHVRARVLAGLDDHLAPAADVRGAAPFKARVVARMVELALSDAVEAASG